MAYYNRDCEELKICRSDLVYLNKGGCAIVFKYDDIILKIYRGSTALCNRMRPLLFDELRSIDNKHFIKLLDIYCDMDDSQLLDYHNGDFKFIVNAYTTKYYEPKNLDILNEPIDYFLTNLYELEMLFNELAKNGILTSDVKADNTITSDDGIVIIDPDLFSASFPSVHKKIQNKKNLLMLFRELFLSSMSVSDVSCLDIINYTKILNDLFDLEVREDTDLTSELSKKLKCVKRPIDYFVK